MPTGIAFQGNKNRFNVYVLESGHGLPSRCNEQDQISGGVSNPNNPFTPDILVFGQNGGLPIATLGKPSGGGDFSRQGRPLISALNMVRKVGGCSRPTLTKRRMAAARTAVLGS
jgi:hypothetical protein